MGMSPTRPRLIILELVLAGGIVAVGVLARLVWSRTTILAMFAVASLWIRGEGPAGVGLERRRGARRSSAGSPGSTIQIG